MESLFTTVFEYIHVWLSGILKTRKSWPITGICAGLGILFWWMAETEKITNIQFWFLFAGILVAEAFFLYLMHRFPVGEAGKVNQIWKRMQNTRCFFPLKRNVRENWKKLWNICRKPRLL